MEKFNLVCWKNSLWKYMLFSGFILSLTAMKVLLYLPFVNNSVLQSFILRNKSLYVPSSDITCYNLLTARWLGDKTVTEKCLIKSQHICMTSPYLQGISTEFCTLWNWMTWKILRQREGEEWDTWGDPWFMSVMWQQHPGDPIRIGVLLSSMICKCRQCYINCI